jgi:hypothetical protein
LVGDGGSNRSGSDGSGGDGTGLVGDGSVRDRLVREGSVGNGSVVKKVSVDPPSFNCLAKRCVVTVVDKFLSVFLC